MSTVNIGRYRAIRLIIHCISIFIRGLRSINWVPYSPDFNPIEHLWDILGRRVARREPQTRGELIRILQEEWKVIPQAAIRELIRSMRNRCVEAVAANGGHTRY